MESREIIKSVELTQEILHPPISLTRFIKQMGINTITAWRWRRDGKLRTVNICGRVYVPAEEVANFNRRAAAGEFARTHVTPKSRVKNAGKPTKQTSPSLATAA